MKASHKLSQEQASLVKDKQEVILALSSKVKEFLYFEFVYSISLLSIL